MKIKVAVITGALLLAGAAALMVIAFAGDSPIEVGDGSITFQADSTQQNGQNDKQLTVNKLLRKVKTIDFGVYSTDVPPKPPVILQSIDVNGRAWTLSSVTSQVQVSPQTVVPLLQDSVAANCTVAWTVSVTGYSCATTDGSQLTPATLTFSDGTTLTLTCPDGAGPVRKKCVVILHYKRPLASAGSAKQKATP